MQQVLIDACGWVACMDAKLNVERDLEALFGPCEWVLLSSVAAELEALATERSRTKPLLLSMLHSKATHQEVEHGQHTDDAILTFAQQHGCATLTVDNNLKHRLFEANLPVVEVRQGNHLYLLESL
jgi:rRNA-processing protein FCF1